MQVEDKRPVIIPQSAATLLSTREKLTTIARKMMLYVYFRRDSVFDIGKLLATMGGEARKCLMVLAVLEGIGLTFKVSDTKMVYRGFEGMIARFHGR